VFVAYLTNASAMKRPSLKVKNGKQYASTKTKRLGELGSDFPEY